MTQIQTAGAIRLAFAAGEKTAQEVVRGSLDRISHLDARLRAFLEVAGERALDEAREMDRLPVSARSLDLAGVPVAVKDNICTAGIRTTAGSRMLEGFIPPGDATVVSRLRRAGAVVIGKTNCDEFAMGSSNENSAFGPTRNPWALDRVPGGSSGGSAAAVAAGMVPVALGSDTGGSVRQPAALCGVVGLKPSYGRVSRSGLIAFASSLDQIGPIAATVEDAARVLTVMAGADAADATSSTREVPDFAARLTGEVRGLRIGIFPAALGDAVDEDVALNVRQALDVLASRGASLVEIDLPHAAFGTAVYYLIATAEASSNLARYDGVRYGFRAKVAAGRKESPGNGSALAEMYEQTRALGFGAEVKRRIMLGTYALSAGYAEQYYVKAQQVRTLVRQDYDCAFQDADVIVTPTSPTPAFLLGERTDDPLQMYMADVLTVGPSLAGLPAISVPCGFSSDGLPVGLQIIGRMFDEETTLRVADAYQRETGWHLRRPGFRTGSKTPAVT